MALEKRESKSAVQLKTTYGSLSDAPITRGDQGKYEIREGIK
jgi:hypothetical protein